MEQGSHSAGSMGSCQLSVSLSGVTLSGLRVPPPPELRVSTSPTWAAQERRPALNFIDKEATDACVGTWVVGF